MTASEWTTVDEAVKPVHNGFFFEPETMRYFGSSISKRALRRGATVYFVTGEFKWDWTERLWSVRAMDNSGRIFTMGQFGGFSSSREAWRWLEDRIIEVEGGKLPTKLSE